MSNCLVIDKRLDILTLKPRSLFCIGGTRSGKSDFALTYANHFQGQKTFIATMQKNFSTLQNSAVQDSTNNEERQDTEILARIQKHQNARDNSWTTIEEPFDIVHALELAKNQNSSIILLDCITLWLSNLLCLEESEETILAKVETLADKIQHTQIPLIIVSNEVGMGIVPLYKSARLFRDIQGRTNQILAKVCEAVVTFSCGIPLLIKG